MEELFCQLLNVPGVNDVRQARIRTAKQLVLEPSLFEVRVLLKSWKIKISR
jgi:hypothetical protein